MEMLAQDTVREDSDEVTRVLMELQQVTAKLELYVNGEPLPMSPLDMIEKAQELKQQAVDVGANPDTLRTYTNKFPLLFTQVRLLHDKD